MSKSNLNLVILHINKQFVKLCFIYGEQKCFANIIYQSGQKGAPTLHKKDIKSHLQMTARLPSHLDYLESRFKHESVGLSHWSSMSYQWDQVAKNWDLLCVNNHKIKKDN